MGKISQVIDFNRNLLGEADTFVDDLAEANLIVDGETIAKITNLNTRTVRDLAQRGIIEKIENDRYNLVATLRAYTSHLREMAAGRGDEHSQIFLTAERARLAKEQADGVALKNAALRKELVPAREVEEEWITILRRIRSGMLAVPSRVRQASPALTASDIEIIDNEIRRALEGQADGE